MSFIVTIKTTRPNPAVKWFSQSTKAVFDQTESYVELIKSSKGYVKSDIVNNPDGLTSTIVQEWSSRAAYNKFLISNQDTISFLDTARDAYNAANGIVRSVTFSA